MNRVTLMGHLGKDPELRYTNGGVPVCSATLATTDKWTKDGEKQEKTEWHKLNIWGKPGEAFEKYLQKGDQVLVEGSIETRKWEDKDGNTRYTTEIKVSQWHFTSTSKKQGKAIDSDAPSANFDQSFNDDDIPF